MLRRTLASKVSVKAKVAVLGAATLLLATEPGSAADERAAQALLVSVNAASNVYGSVGYGCSGPAIDPPCSGYLPPRIAVQAGGILTFTVPTGQRIIVNRGTGDTPNNADGVGSVATTSSNTGYGSLSGITAPHAGYLVGVFVAAGGPTGSAPPAAIDFVKKGTGFASLAPLLNQVFFIGDGLTGDGKGTRQIFRVPAGAAVLYLGLSDACGYNGPPGCFNDNSGSLPVIISASLAVAQPTLTPGIYNAFAKVILQNQLTGNYCFPTAESDYGLAAKFIITYNGAAKAATAAIQVPAIPAFNSSPQGGPFTALLTLPRTPTVGNAWNGSASETLQPLGVTFSSQAFTATLNIIDRFSFVGTMTLDRFSPGVPPDNIGDFCGVTLQYSAAFASPLN